MSIDWNSLVVGKTMGVFGDAVRYFPITPALDVAGQPTFDFEGNAIGTPGVPYGTTGVFDAAYIEVTPAGAGPFTSTDSMEFGAPGGITEARPVLGVQPSAMLTYPIQGDKLTVFMTATGRHSKLYVVKEVQEDSHGWALLLLNLAP